MADPWFKFYPTDWQAEPALRMCSFAARGLWIEMICVMHKATPYGHLLVNGHCPTDAQLSVLLGAPPEQLSGLIGELEQAGVFSRTREGVIYSRKMSRMTKKAATARKNGRKGGNPSLGKQKGNPASDNPKDKAEVKPQKPEARSQIEEDKSSSTQEEVDFYDQYLMAHPKAVGSDAGAAFFADLVGSGVDPTQIIEAAKSYAKTVSGWSSEGKVQQSDNFLDPERGKWKSFVPKQAAPVATEAETIDFWAERINGDGFVAASSIKPALARAILASGKVTPEKMKERGIAA